MVCAWDLSSPTLVSQKSALHMQLVRGTVTDVTNLRGLLGMVKEQDRQTETHSHRANQGLHTYSDSLNEERKEREE